ncbi:MAG TPA: hypothetical protein VHG51_00290 [Longimicrobiaceae bacterium]|nr:hypothetical protein [Longimicrobiaceae bacterium]
MLANAAQEATAAPEAVAFDRTDILIATCPYCASGTVDPGQWPGLELVTRVEI